MRIVYAYVSKTADGCYQARAAWRGDGPRDVGTLEGEPRLLARQAREDLEVMRSAIEAGAVATTPPLEEL